MSDPATNHVSPATNTVSKEPRFSEDRLVAIGTSVLREAGTPEHIAALVARALVLANLMGHDSHGLSRLPQYVSGIRAGHIRPAAEAQLISSRGPVGIVDGGWGFGQVAAQFATQTAIDLATAQGIGAVTIHQCNHIGRVGEYVQTIARARQIGIVCCNSGAGVAPFGGVGRVLGTNPIAWAAPLPDGEVVLDIATATLPEGKLKIALYEGKTVAPGVIFDREGNPSVEPADFYAGGWLVPFAGHKGSGLSMLVELTGGLLSGMGASCDPAGMGGNGTVIISLDVAAFTPLETYFAQAETFRREAKRRGAGANGNEILLPGELEERRLALHRAGGVYVHEPVRRDFTHLADELSLDLGDFALR
jgi:LDH2 family malate/lactate/ureidoglycolate dehydrogenase